MSERADKSLAALDEAGQAIARRVFLRLVSFGENSAVTGRQQPVAALGAGDDPGQVTGILRHLTEARLLRIEGDEASGAARVDLADEDLLASWPTLQGWIRAHGTAEQQRRQLEADAAEWQHDANQGRSEVGLLDRGQLTELAAWLTPSTKRDLGVSDVAESFIAASRAAARRRWWPRQTSIGTVLAILLILLLMATPVILIFVVMLTASVIHRFG
ncbi:MAG TPA: hypothetical protein VHN14_14140 [Kofleriaceae bacterium]|nr:hypothetical protein [Kofleriaceae bacterium]